jgi:hypothetical protein
MIEGKIRYVISGSSAILLFAEAENIKMYTVDEDGNIAETTERSLDEKTKLSIKENLSKFGTPSDIDISYTKNNIAGGHLIDDEFVLQNNARIVSGNIDGKEYYFESPLDYVVKVFAHKYLGFGGNSRASKKFNKLAKMEVVLDAVLQSISSDELVKEIEKVIQQESDSRGDWVDSNDNLQNQRKAITVPLLADPHSMYEWLSSAYMEEPGGSPTKLSININKFPKVKELIDKMSTSHNKSST